MRGCSWYFSRELRAYLGGFRKICPAGFVCEIYFRDPGGGTELSFSRTRGHFNFSSSHAKKKRKALI